MRLAVFHGILIAALSLAPAGLRASEAAGAARTDPKPETSDPEAKAPPAPAKAKQAAKPAKPAKPEKDEAPLAKPESPGESEPEAEPEDDEDEDPDCDRCLLASGSQAVDAPAFASSRPEAASSPEPSA
jgi:hypothetical protein